MNPTARDRISVDLQGLKAALLKRADEMGVSPSDVVRRVLADALAAQPIGHRSDRPRGSRRSRGAVQRVSLRMRPVHVLALNDAARRAGLSLGDHVAGLLEGVAALGGEGDRLGSLAALTASNAEMSSLGRDLRHLTNLLARGESQAARFYRERLDTVADEVRAHLRMSSRALSDLQPRRSVQSARP
ncbi:hypothetical protein ACWA7J_13515 [Leptothrix sp. BB-4]